MSSIVGHVLGGVIAAKAAAGNIPAEQRRRFYILAALTSVLPDLDVVVFMLFHPLKMTPHRGASHSLLFAAMSALVLTFLCARLVSLTRARLFACLFAAYTSHLVLDYLMGGGPEVPFFWPISGRGYLSPVQLVPTAYYGLDANAFLQILLFAWTYIGIALELVIFVPWLYLSSARTTARRTALVMMSAAGVLITVLVYHGVK